MFLNALLTREVRARLARDGFRVYRHRLVPPNDGGLCLGQLAVAAAAASSTLDLAGRIDRCASASPARWSRPTASTTCSWARSISAASASASAWSTCPRSRLGDYVLVHVGFALSRIDEAEARRVFAFLEEMNQLDELEAPPP